MKIHRAEKLYYCDLCGNDETAGIQIEDNYNIEFPMIEICPECLKKIKEAASE